LIDTGQKTELLTISQYCIDTVTAPIPNVERVTAVEMREMHIILHVNSCTHASCSPLSTRQQLQRQLPGKK